MTPCGIDSMPIILFLLLTVSCHGQVASWYGEEHRGKLMANGKPFNPDKLTCASWFHPFGTKLRVRHGSRSVVVTVTDRGPHRRLVRQGRKIDLSLAAFKKLRHPDIGLIRVRIERARWAP